MHERKPELPRSQFARQLLTDELVSSAADIGILLADEDDIYTLYACRAIRRQLEALVDHIRRDLEYEDRFYQCDAVDYLMDVIRVARASLLRELGASHPTRWSRGAEPPPIPPECARGYQADLARINTRIAQHFSTAQ
jgi:hypothetical protein